MSPAGAGHCHSRPPLPGIPFLVSEAIGSLAGPNFYRRTDPQKVQARQAYLHGQVHNQAGSDDRYAGLLAWQGGSGISTRTQTAPSSGWLDWQVFSAGPVGGIACGSPT